MVHSHTVLNIFHVNQSPAACITALTPYHLRASAMVNQLSTTLESNFQEVVPIQLLTSKIATEYLESELQIHTFFYSYG